jgi:membrane protein YqaA with SNARE-associated domain
MIRDVLEFIFRTLTNPEQLIQVLSTGLSGWYGYLLLFAIVFAETGLLVGFMLPGDSLMFTVGVVAGAGQLNIVLINIVLMAAAVIGDGVGYWLGKRTGPKIFNRPDSRLFRKEYLERTQGPGRRGRVRLRARVPGPVRVLEARIPAAARDESLNEGAPTPLSRGGEPKEADVRLFHEA